MTPKEFSIASKLGLALLQKKDLEAANAALRAENKRQREEVTHLQNIIMGAKKTILDYGGFGGEDHKQWALDQALRYLTGDDYEIVIKEYCTGEDGPNTYEWGKGIAP